MHRREYQAGEQIPGTVYRVLKPIAAGGMGSVYEVEDTTVGKKYVLKTLLPTLGAREDLARRMAAEARVLAKLQHPNIVEVITAGLTGDDMRLPYYVMERLEGLNLRTVLEKKGALDIERAICIAIDLLDALAHAHDNGVIHRDVKPENIYLHQTRTGGTTTKLLDFGIMRMLDRGFNGKETQGRFVGTLRYAAPEQLKGDEVGPACDLYAAGLVLYEMLAGRGPFDDEADAHRVAAATLRREPPPISRFARVPRDLEALLKSALEKNPAGRPKDAFTFAAALRKMAATNPGGRAAPDKTLVNELAQLATTQGPEAVMDQGAGLRTTIEFNTTSLGMALAPTERESPQGASPHSGRPPTAVTLEERPPARGGGRFGIVIALVSMLVVAVAGISVLRWKLQSPSPGRPAAEPTTRAPSVAISTSTPTSTATSTASTTAILVASSSPFASPSATASVKPAVTPIATTTASQHAVGGRKKSGGSAPTATASQGPKLDVGPGF